MKWTLMSILCLASCVLAPTVRADAPDAKTPTRPGTTTRPIEPGDVGGTTVAPTSKDGPLPLAIRWWGQACVSIETFWGLDVVIDPFPVDGSLGFSPPNLAADLVLLTDARSDHTAEGTVKGEPFVVRGVSDGGQCRTDIDHVLDRPPNEPTPSFRPRTEVTSPTPNAVYVRGIPSGVGDASSGQGDAPSVLFLIEASGVRILHCGGLAGPITDAQRKAIGRVDVLILPVGGDHLLDATAAIDVVRQIAPRRFIWPVQFRKGEHGGGAPLDPFLMQVRRAGLYVRDVDGNTIAVTRLPPGRKAPVGSPAVLVTDAEPVKLRPDLERALLALRGDRQTLIDELGGLTREQLDHKPSDGSHTIRWNFEHTTARELGFFSQVYAQLDPEIPVINWNPAQMPIDYTPRHPDWGPEEMVRHVRRIGAFTERFSYLLHDTPPTLRIEGTRFPIEYLTAMVVGHYQNHTTKAVHKFTLPDWPRRR
jgi:L-ascorbate metabolism protein UlaG (beta-lactamase superfamily)